MDKPTSRRFTVYDSRRPGLKKYVIEHDLAEMARKIFGKEKPPGKPAAVIRLNRDQLERDRE